MRLAVRLRIKKRYFSNARIVGVKGRTISNGLRARKSDSCILKIVLVELCECVVAARLFYPRERSGS